MKFSISPAVFEKLPTACFGVVAVLDAVPSPEADAAIAVRLAEAVTDCQAALAGVALKESPEILPYREAFRALGQNPNKYPCSIEALLTRIAKGKGMPSINTLVDLGNAVSLRHRLPIGAHDIATFRDGVLEVRPAVEGDRFLPFGGGEPELPDPGEVVYVSGGEVRTRRWTWRQSETGKITPETRSVLYPVDGFLDHNRQEVLAARDELAELAKTLLGASVSVGFIGRDHPEFSFWFTPCGHTPLSRTDRTGDFLCPVCFITALCQNTRQLCYNKEKEGFSCPYGFCSLQR